MKKIGFEEYLKREIVKINKQIEQKNSELNTLSKKFKELYLEADKEQLISLYRRTAKINSIKALAQPKEKVLIEFFRQTMENAIKEKIRKLTEYLNNLQLLKNSFENNTFVKPVILNAEIIKILIEFGSDYNVEPYDMLNELLLVSKLNAVIEQKNSNSIVQLLNGLSKLFNNNLTLKNENDIKAVEFILRKIKYEIEQELYDSDPYNKKYLEKVTLSINEALVKTTPEEREDYQETIEISKKPVQKQLLNAESKLSEYMITNKTLGNKYSKEVLDMLDDGQLLIIEETFQIIKKSKNKNLVKLLKRLINDVISSCRYINITQNNEEEPSDINHEIECLQLVIKAIKVKYNIEPLYSYLINEKTGNPIILEDIKGLPEEDNEAVYNLLANLDTFESTEIAKKGKTRIFESSNKNITLMYATYQNEIIIIGLRTSIIQKKSLKTYFKLIKEQLSNEQNQENQELYSILIEKELDLLYSEKTDKALLKSKKDSI